MIGRRVAGWGLGLAGLVSLGLVVTGRRWDAAVLTLTTAVGIINTLWLEGALSQILQPGKPRVSRGAVATFVARFALWVLLFALLFAFREHVNPWAAVAGIGCYVVALGVVGTDRRLGSRGEE